MSVALVVAVFVGGLAVAVAKGILGKEIQGRIERRIMRSVEATIASLPDALQAEYAEEWRAELAAVMAMPLTAAVFARGLRSGAAQLEGEALPMRVSSARTAPALPPMTSWLRGDRRARYVPSAVANMIYGAVTGAVMTLARLEVERRAASLTSQSPNVSRSASSSSGNLNS